jgi:hypothetical protein
MFNVPPAKKGPRDKLRRRMLIAAVVVMVVVCFLLISLYVYPYVGILD